MTMANAGSAALKVLFILDNGLSAPSAMVRALQYRELLEQRPDVSAAFANHRSPLLNKFIAFLGRSLFGRPFLRFFGQVDKAVTLIRERRLVKRAAGYDILYLVKVPSLRLYRKLSALNGPKLVMDVNDGLWLPAYHGGGWENLDKMLGLVDGVICENRYVADYARKFLDKVFVVHDPPQVEVFDLYRGQVRKREDQVVLGWIGGRFSSDALYSIWEPLERLFAKHSNIHLRIVGTDPDKLPRFEKVRYSIRPKYDQASMAREALAMDIGLFPLFATEDALVRGTLKAMIYMSGEAVAACRNIGENSELIQDGVNGVLADTPEEWFERLDRLILDAAGRRRIAAAGLRTIRDGFTRGHCLDRLIDAFRACREF